MQDFTSETSAAVKAGGIMLGECLFGLFGPFLFIHPLRWFEITYVGAMMLGVLFGGVIGYGVAVCALRVHRRAAVAGRQWHQIPPGHRQHAH